MLKISQKIIIPDHEIEIQAIRAAGPGGQNVNKLSSAIHLRFNIHTSSLPDFYKQKLLNLNDQRINKEGILIIKAKRFRTQEKNKADALNRLQALIKTIIVKPKPRKKTKPTRASQLKRLNQKTRRGQLKASRKKVLDED